MADKKKKKFLMVEIPDIKEKEKWKQAAIKDGRTLSSWVRFILNEATSL